MTTEALKKISRSAHASRDDSDPNATEGAAIVPQVRGGSSTSKPPTEQPAKQNSSEMQSRQSMKNKSGRRDLLWSAWLMGVVLLAVIQRVSALRTPWTTWIEQAVLPLVRDR
jgi:hypothetical protein